MSFPDFDATGDLDFDMVVTGQPEVMDPTAVNDHVAISADGTQLAGAGAGAEPEQREDGFVSAMRLISQRLGTIAGKVSEAGIRRLSAANGFDVFEDKTDAGNTRLSLGGKILLLDIDIDPKADKVLDVKLELGSTMAVSNNELAFSSSKSVEPKSNANAILTRSLTEQTLLDEFSTILHHLSRADQLTVPEAADCFVCMDEIAIALLKLKQHHGWTDPNGEYGVPVQNVNKHLGLGIWYWTGRRKFKLGGSEEEADDEGKAFAFLTMMPLNNSIADTFRSDLTDKCIMRYSQEWIKDTDKIEWNDPSFVPGAKGYFALELNPPVVVSKREIAGFVDNVHNLPEAISECDEEGFTRMNRTVHMPNNKTNRMQLVLGNAMTDAMVEVDFLPLQHPRDLPQILAILRKHQVLNALWRSATTIITKEEHEQSGDDDVQQEESPQEISFADAIMECDDLPNWCTNKVVSVLRTDVGLKLTLGETTHEILVENNGKIVLTPENSLLRNALQKTLDIPVSACFVTCHGSGDEKTATSSCTTTQSTSFASSQTLAPTSSLY